jgi:hypothetical protein
MRESTLNSRLTLVLSLDECRRTCTVFFDDQRLPGLEKSE